jgi:hypothetical protein
MNDDVWNKQTKTREALKWIVDVHGLEATCNMDSKLNVRVYVTRRDMESLCELIKEYLPSKTIYRSIEYTIRAMGSLHESYTLKPSVEEYIRTQTQPPTVYDPLCTIFVIREWDVIDTMVHGPLLDRHECTTWSYSSHLSISERLDEGSEDTEPPPPRRRFCFPQKWSS